MVGGIRTFLALLQFKLVCKELVVLTHFSRFLSFEFDRKAGLLWVAEAKSKLNELEVLGHGGLIVV